MPVASRSGGDPRVVTVAVDANGADLGPAEVAAGAALAVQRGGIRVLLFGPADQLRDVGDGVEVIDAPVSIAKVAEPASAVRAHPDASIVQAWRAVADGKAEALVSGGSTGTALAAGLFNVKRARGIYRPALAVTLPVPKRAVTLLDVGANTDVRTEQLVQFAYMGAAYATAVLDVKRPLVGLLNIGEEETRGTPQLFEVYEQLAAATTPAFEFVGNVEGHHFAEGEIDIVVSDGFTGNVALKFAEAVSSKTIDVVDDARNDNLRSRIGGWLLDPAIRRARTSIDPAVTGGAYMLGLRQLGVVPHGRFGRFGISQAILRAAHGVEENLIERTHSTLEAAGVLRRQAQESPLEPPASVRS
ncbi:MAG TPA: phosphate acyltransferase PlsX [Baekduia sp.]|nr:phosphate acyltransferase PlsX [Baekduia sp.]